MSTAGKFAEGQRFAGWIDALRRGTPVNVVLLGNRIRTARAAAEIERLAIRAGVAVGTQNRVAQPWLTIVSGNHAAEEMISRAADGARPPSAQMVVVLDLSISDMPLLKRCTNAGFQLVAFGEDSAPFAVENAFPPGDDDEMRERAGLLAAMGLFDAAYDAYRRIVSCKSSEQHFPDAHLAMAQIASRTNRLDECKRDLEFALAGFAAAERWDAYTDAAGQLARVWVRCRDLERANQCIRGALDAVPPDLAGDSLGWLLIIAGATAVAGHKTRGLQSILARLSSIEPGLSPHVKLHALRFRGYCSLLLGRNRRRSGREATLTDLERAVQLALQSGDNDDLALTYSTLGYARFVRGESTLAKLAFQRSLEHAIVDNNQSRIAAAYVHMAALASLEGELPRALSLTKILRETEPRYDPFSESGLCLAQARAAIHLRQTALVRERDYRAVYEHFVSFGDPLGLQCVATAYALVLQRRGNRALIGRIVETVIGRIRRIDVSALDFLFFCDAVSDDRLFARARRLTTALRGRCDVNIAEGAVAILDAIEARRGGRIAAARELALRAARRFESIGWRFFQARALRLAGRPVDAAVIEAEMGAVPVDHDAARLSPRESVIARLAATGRADASVAELLGLSESVVRSYMVEILRKLGMRSRAELTAFAGRGPWDGAAAARKPA